jgi:hypothetical protein
MRDLTVHGDDLIVATHGRSFWILDDITRLRQLNAEVAHASAHLFTPQEALRVRWNKNPDTPLPPEVPAGKNPPDGAIIDYFLAKDAAGPVTLEILDGNDQLVRKYSSADRVEPMEEIAPKVPIPMYWVRAEKVLSAEAGTHRWVWNVRYAPPQSLGHGYPISAIVQDTPFEPQGAWALPGRYTVKLAVDGKSYTRPLALKMDPRVKSPPADLEQQFAIEREASEGMNESFRALVELKSTRQQVKALMEKDRSTPAKQKLSEFDKKAAELEGTAIPGFSGVPPSGKRPENFSTLNQRFRQILAIADAADAAPATETESVAKELEIALRENSARWTKLKKTDMVELNQLLGKEKAGRIDPEVRDGERPSSDVDGDDQP